MFKRCLSFVLIVTLLSASFSRLFIYAGFNVNQKFIASTLCENRDKPQLHCNGKCYLMKKIKLAEEKEKNQEKQSQQSDVQLSFTVRDFKISAPVTSIPAHSFAEPHFQISDKTDFIFQPPKV